MVKNTKKSITSNFFWRLFERTGAQLVAFIVQIVLARLLAPEVYGTIALVTVFTSILQVFVDSGFGNALIQKKNADDLDFSSVFYFNIVSCGILYLIMFLLAPAIAGFYDNNELIPVIRVLSLTLIIAGAKNVQQAYISRTMQFKRFFFATLGGTLGAALIGITMAYLGFGVWALVAQHIFNAAIDTIILWVMVKWRPQKAFSFQRLRVLFDFGWKLLVSSLLNNAYTNIRQLIIGKMYTTSDLAQYNRGRQFPYLFISNINTSIDSVLLPVISQAQDNVEMVKSMTRRSIKVSTYVLAPFMIGLAVVGTPLVRLVLTEKWLPCVPYMVIFCITFMFYPIHTANLNAIKAMGRSDLILKLEILKKIVGMIALFSTMWIGTMAMAYSLLFESLASQIINSWPNKRLLEYGYLEQVKDILPSIILAIVMGICIYPIRYIGLPDILILAIQVPSGIIIYIIGSKIMHIDSYGYVFGVLKSYLRKK